MEINTKQDDIAKNAIKAFVSSCMCSLSQIKPFQNEINNTNADIIKAASGLAGGLFSKGSTCGVVFSGALTFAMMMDKKITEWTAPNEIQLHNIIKDYYN